MKRLEHTIKPNKRTTFLRRFIFLDVENYIVKMNDSFTALPLRLCVAKYVRYRTLEDYESEVVSFKDADSVIKFIVSKTSKKSPIYVIAYNARHDFNTLDILNRLANLGFSINIVRALQGCCIIRCKQGDKTIVLLDALNFLTGKLADWGVRLGLQKGVVDFTNANDDTLLEYCINDVEILHKAIDAYIHFLQKNDLGDMRLTKSSQAFNAWRHRFMQTPVKIHTNDEALMLERYAYGGGYVWAFRLGCWNDDTFYKLDVNSMYPYIMSNIELPYELIGVRHNPTIKDIEVILQDYAIICDCVVKPKTPIFRRFTHKGVIYPLYRFRGVFTTYEVLSLLKECAILKVYRCCVYKKAVLFSEFVKWFYSKRLEYKQSGNIVYEQLCKIMLNSLYGKFGSKAKCYKPRNDAYIDGDLIEEICDNPMEGLKAVYLIGNTPYTEIDEGESFYSFPAIPAHISAYGRLMIYNYIQLAGVENCYYTDTDSIITNEKGFQRLKPYIDEHTLGRFKVEGVSGKLIINAPKEYAFNGVWKRKGIPKNAMQIDDNTFIVDCWQGILPHHNPKYSNVYGIRHLTKKLRHDFWNVEIDNNGNVHPLTKPNKFDTHPLTLYPLK